MMKKESKNIPSRFNQGYRFIARVALNPASPPHP
jgi:hypothetical protein